MDYSKLSDFEINKAVAMVAGRFKKYDYSEISGNFHSGKPSQDNYRVGVIHDFCNNPSDAWPIIVENKIDIRFEAGFMNKWEAQHVKHLGDYDVDIIGDNYDENPLRAAMIVYLMMQD